MRDAIVSRIRDGEETNSLREMVSNSEEYVDTPGDIEGPGGSSACGGSSVSTAQKAASPESPTYSPLPSPKVSRAPSPSPPPLGERAKEAGQRAGRVADAPLPALPYPCAESGSDDDDTATAWLKCVPITVRYENAEVARQVRRSHAVLGWTEGQKAAPGMDSAGTGCRGYHSNRASCRADQGGRSG